MAAIRLPRLEVVPDSQRRFFKDHHARTKENPRAALKGRFARARIAEASRDRAADAEGAVETVEISAGRRASSPPKFSPARSEAFDALLHAGPDVHAGQQPLD